jgi:NAD-dependent deacetylase
VFFTGAGISVGAGLPTYRGSRGIYENSNVEPPTIDDVTPERLPALWDRFRPRLKAFDELGPARAHLAIATFEAVLPSEVTVVTQNVDGLHTRAGSTRVIELHGTLNTMRCLGYGHVHSVHDVEWREGTAPQCGICGEMCRPNVVLFGETLPSGPFSEATEAIRLTTTIVAVGTSAQVYPAAGLIGPSHTAGATCIWVNPETAPPGPGWRWIKGDADEQLTALLS